VSPAQLESVVAQMGSPEDAAHAKRLLENLSASLSTLSPRQQKIFTLSRLDGRSYLEIAEQLQVSASTVQKELKLIMAICVGVLSRLDPP
ncbi:sigma-70 family RNA polymerase sigma factor, partial [Pseudomonas tremae]